MWNYALNNSEHAEATEEEIKMLITNGKISSDTLVWKAGMDSWAKAKDTELGKVIQLHQKQTPPPIKRASFPKNPIPAPDIKALWRPAFFYMISFILIYSIITTNLISLILSLSKEESNVGKWLASIASIIVGAPLFSGSVRRIIYSHQFVQAFKSAVIPWLKARFDGYADMFAESNDTHRFIGSMIFFIVSLVVAGGLVKILFTLLDAVSIVEMSKYPLAISLGFTAPILLSLWVGHLVFLGLIYTTALLPKPAEQK